MKRKRTKATDINQHTKIVVWERDKHSCIYCGKGGLGVLPSAHFLSRAKGGLGVEQNIVTLCMDCHYKYDFGTAETRSTYRHFIRDYLQQKYGQEWSEQNLFYRK